MAKVRQDAWSHEDDLLLAETVLRHIREGSTQLNAFEEVGDALNRTSAACGFRWNAEVRNKYSPAIDLAKRQRKENKRELRATTKRTMKATVATQEADQDASLIIDPDEMNTIQLNDVIHYLQTLDKDIQSTKQSKGKTDALHDENNRLHARIMELEKELILKEKKLLTVEEDYQTFIQIMERARKMTVLSEQTNDSPKFKMDKNGNLEQVSIQTNTN